MSGQTLDKADFVIFNFVHRYHGSIPPHLGNFVDNYYWIVPTDSITGEKVFTISPMYIDSMSQIQVDRCAAGDLVDFFGYGEGVSVEYRNEIDSLLRIIKKGRIKIQTINIKWYEDDIRKKEKIDIYAIPVSGVFCNCIQVYYNKETKRDAPYGQVYVPLFDFKYNKSFFLNTRLWKNVKYADYSMVNFASFIPWGVQYKTGSLVKTSK
jgi:hypothetical protein